MAIEKIFGMLQDDLKQVEEFINKNFISDVTLIPTISKYLTDGGGKRLRPVLLLLCSRLSGYQSDGGDKHIRYSCVMEYIHAATLLHDDVIDFASTRRGNPSANVKWGNEASVLVGDYLFSKSFALVAIDSNPKITQTIANATVELAEGEVKELTYLFNVSITEKEYLDVIHRKTASLIGASCKVGAYLGSLSDQEVEALYSFGQNIGMAFQLVDDIFDYTSEEEVIGKPVGNDIKEGNLTLPLIYMYQHLPQEEKKRFDDLVQTKEVEADDLDWVVELTKKNGGIEYTREKAKRYIEKSKENLSQFPSSEYKDSMLLLADYILQRQK